MYDYSISKSECKTNLTSLCNQWTKNKVALFLYFTHHGMSFHRSKKYIYIYLSAILKFAAIQNESKRAETK